LFVLAACGGAPAPTQTPFIIVVTAGPGSGVNVGLVSPTPAAPTSAPSRAPANTSAPTLAAATPASTEVILSTYGGSSASFSLQYPSDWTAVDREQSQKRVVITSPDTQASLLLIYGSAGTLTTEEVLQTFLSNFSVPALKTSNQRKNADGSLSVDLQYKDSTGSPLLGSLRFVRQSTSANFYVIIFSATPEKFAQTQALGVSLLNSFQERTSIVRQSTPPVIGGATSTATSIPAPATDTPLPPPTNTPRPVGAAFRVDAQARGYEDWGAPSDGCNTVATGNWANNHPGKRLTIDITLMNNSSRAIQGSDIAAGMVSDAGVDLLTCKVSDIPTAAARGSSSFGLWTFVEKNQFVSVLRMTIFGSTVRVCFGRNNPPSALNCG